MENDEEKERKPVLEKNEKNEKKKKTQFFPFSFLLLQSHPEDSPPRNFEDSKIDGIYNHPRSIKS